MTKDVVTRKVYDLLKEAKCTLNFMEVQAEVGRLLGAGKEDDLQKAISDRDTDEIYFLLFGG